MKKNFRIIIIPIIVSILWAGGVTGLFGQPKSKHPETPLPQALLNILANEISGQMIFDNEVILAGAPWVRDAGEFSEKGRLFEAAKIDGASTWQSYYKIVLPLGKPAIATLAIINTLFAWNDLLIPLIS